MAILQYRDVDGTLKDLSFPGEKGESAYEIAKRNGYSGTETDWLISLKGDVGKDKYSSTETAIGTWINGKTVYRKVITTKMPAVGSTTFINGPTGATHLINLRAFCWCSEGYDWNINGGYSVICDVIYYNSMNSSAQRKNQISIANPSNGASPWVGMPVYIIFDYIK